jgi:hypothetical protein
MTEQMQVEVVRWSGPQFYAARQEWGRIRVWPVGENDRDAQREARRANLGTPFWCDTEEEASQA